VLTFVGQVTALASKYILLRAATKIAAMARNTCRQTRIVLVLPGFLFCVCRIAPAQAQNQPRVGSVASSEPTSALLAQARSAVQAGSFSSAENLTRKYVSQQDASSDGHYLLAYILSHQGKAKESLAEYTRAAQLRPPSANDFKVIAVDYVLLGDFLDADQWFTKALEMNPSDADGWYYLGRTKYNENRFSQAIDAFHTCLKLDAHNVKAEDNLGLSYEGLNQVEEATQAFRTAIAWQAGAGERDAQPYLNMGMLLLEQEHPEASLPYLEKGVDIAPQSPKAHEQLGRAYLKLKRWKEGDGELEKAVQLAPDSSSLHYELAVSYRDQGLKDQAKKEFDRCTELNATHSSVETPNP
jgi:tetratricopeptide (TPR) repeat protein